MKRKTLPTQIILLLLLTVVSLLLLMLRLFRAEQIQCHGTITKVPCTAFQHGCSVCGTLQSTPSSTRATGLSNGLGCMTCQEGFALLPSSPGCPGYCTATTLPDYDAPDPLWSCTTVRDTMDYHCHAEDWAQMMKEGAAGSIQADLKGPSSLPCLEVDTVMAQPAKPQSNGQEVPGPLLVMTTTVGDRQSANPIKAKLQQAAGTTWRSLQPEVLTLVAVDSKTSISPGGHPRVICPKNNAGTPTVKGMLIHAEKKALQHGAAFAGYTNGDIAFDSSLVDVLTAVEAGIKERTISKRVLVVGKRLNIAHAEPDADKLIAIGRKFSASVLKGNGKAAEFKREVRRALVESSHHWENTWMTEFSEDYLFWTPGTFNWDDIPNYVAGRVGWDSWITQAAIDSGASVIDGTSKLHVSHLTASDGNFAGWNTEQSDKMWNYCAMKAKCEESEAMNEFCDSCFRCKLGGVRQGGFVLAGGESDDSYDRINVVARDDLGSIRAIRNERDVFIGEAANLVHGARLDGRHAAVYLKNTERSEPAISRRPGCVAKGTCCSTQGPWGMEHELKWRWKIKGEWPFLRGRYTAHACKHPDGTSQISKELRVAGVCEPWAWDGANLYDFKQEAGARRCWCEPVPGKEVQRTELLLYGKVK